MASYVLTDDGTFPNNKRADVMRESLENKNLLANKGSMYVGTGISANIGSTANVARTSKIDPPMDNGSIIDDYIIVTNNSSPVGLNYKSLENINTGYSNNSSHIYTNVVNVSNISNGYKEIVITNILPASPSNDVIYYIVEA